MSFISTSVEKRFNDVVLQMNDGGSSNVGDGDIGCAGGNSLPSAIKLCSNSNNCPMKFKFGEIIGRANLTN